MRGLQAEIDSVSFQQYLAGEPPDPVYLAKALKAARSPKLRDVEQNELRRRIITKSHGFGLGMLSFEGLANDVKWRKVHVSSAEVGEMLYATRHPATAIALEANRFAHGVHLYVGDSPSVANGAYL